MSMRFLMSNTFKGAGDLVMNKLRARDKSRRSLVIVPDRFVLSTERLVLDAISEGGTFDIEIMSFRRLTDIILSDSQCKYLSRDLSVMLMHKVISDSKDKLSVYRDGAGYSGFADEAYSAIGSMRNNMVTPEALDGCISGLNASVRAKLKDLNTLYSGYMATLKEGYIDTDSVMDALVEAIPTSDYFDGIDVYVMEYFFLTTKQREILRLILRRAKDINIALVMDDSYPNERLYPHALYSALRGIALEEGIEVIDEYLTEPLAKPLDMISKYLYAYTSPTRVSSQGMIQMYEADDINQEVEGIASSIVKAVRSGKRYRQIGVATADADKYTPVIERVFRRYGIPYFADVRKSLDTQPIARYVMSLIRLRLDRSIPNLLTFAKNPLTALDISMVEDMENYILKYGLTWADLEHPFSIGEDDIYYIGAERTREAIEGMAFVEMPSTGRVSDYVNEIRLLLDRYAILSRNDELSSRLRELGRGIEADLVKTSYERFESILEDMMQILGEENMSLREFADMLYSATSGAKIGAIPSYLDSVYVGNCRESRYMGVTHLYVVGAGIENFPLEHSDNGIISSRERIALASVGLDIEPDPSRRNLEEKLYTLQLLLKPTEKLVLSYNVTDSTKSSDVFRELEMLFEDISISRYSDHYISNDYQNAILSMPNHRVAIDVSAKVAESYLNRHVTSVEALPYLTALKLLEDRGEKINRLTDYDGKVPPSLFFANGRTSVSQLEKYFDCPYQHYLSYGLGLRDRESGVEANLIGLFVHDILCEYLSQYTEHHVTEREVIARFDKLYAELISRDKYILMRKDTQTLSLKRLEGECRRLICLVSQQIANSSYKPAHLELKIGYDENHEYYVEFADGERLGMRGSIDRVDVLDRDVEGAKPCMVIDYKTGHIHSKVADLYYGRKIQIFLYADTLNKIGYDVKGMLYYPIESNYGSKTGCMEGFLLNDLNFMRDVDNSICAGATSKYIKASFKKSGDLSARSVAYTSEQLDGMISYAKQVSTRAIEEIREGVAIKSAYDASTCQYCKFKNICLEANNLRVLSAVDIDDIMEAIDEQRRDD